MHQYVVFDKSVKVNKHTVLSVIKALPVGEELRQELLRKNNIRIDSEKDWYNQQDWLNCFSEIHNLWGEGVLFLIGRAIVGNAKFPKIDDGLKGALAKLDVAYHMNHAKDGKVMFDEHTGEMMEGIGHYRLTEYDEHRKKAIMVCDNPYPSMFDMGIIDELVRRYALPYTFPRVYLDADKETRRKGGRTCTYIIEWE